MSENFLEPEDDTPVPVLDPMEAMPGLAGYIKSKFEDAENGRRVHEERWLTAYKNFRGIYDSTTQYRDSERSKVFIKITKTKVLAAYGQISDILFSNKKFPIVVEPTPVPEGIAEFAHLETPLDAVIQDPYGYKGDGRELLPGATEATMQDQSMDFLGGISNNFPEGSGLRAGRAKMGEPQIEPAKRTALNLEKLIHDQLLDTNATSVFRNAIFESSLLGTGVIKGPLNFYKRIHKWDINPDTGNQVANTINDKTGKSQFIETDVSDLNSVKDLLGHTSLVLLCLAVHALHALVRSQAHP